MKRKVRITEEEFDEKGNLVRRTVTEEDEDDPKVLPQPSDVPWPEKPYDPNPHRRPWQPYWHYYTPTWYSVTTNTSPSQYITFDDKGNLTIVPVEKNEKGKPEDGPEEGLTGAKV